MKDMKKNTVEVRLIIIFVFSISQGRITSEKKRGGGGGLEESQYTIS